MKDWMQGKRVKALILVHHPQELLQTEGIGATTKSLREMGYHCETRLLKAELCGAASWATYFVTIATLSSTSNPLQLHRLPSDLHLPISPRGCGNVIIKHFVKGVTEERFFVGHSRDIVKEENPSFPNFIWTHKGRPVYSCGKGVEGFLQAGQYSARVGKNVDDRHVQPLVKEHVNKL